MARIVGIDLPKNKRGDVALTYIYGIGLTTAQEILAKAGADCSKKVKDWTDQEVSEIRQIINDEYIVEGALRSQTMQNIARLQDIASYRGIRHRLGLPVRGQRSKTNARTRKGRKRTVAGKKKAPRK